jgi:predicted trehalose synthase
VPVAYKLARDRLVYMQTLMMATDVSDEVMDAIAYIEMQRQEKAKDGGFAAACGESLRRLQELLAQEKAAPAAPGSDAQAMVNVEAVTLEIQRIQRMAAGKNNGAGGNRNQRRGRQQHAPNGGSPRRRGRNKGRQPGPRGER